MPGFILAALILSAPPAESAEDWDRQIAFRALAVIQATPAERDAAWKAFLRAFTPGPKNVADVLAALVADERPFRRDDPRADLFRLLTEAAATRPTWDPQDWAAVRDVVAERLSLLLERFVGMNHLQLPRVIDMKLSLGVFTATDVPFLLRAVFDRADHRLLAPLLESVDVSSPAFASDLLKKLDHVPNVRKPSWAHLLAYSLNLRTDEASLRRLLSSVHLDISKQSMTSSRTGYASLRRDSPPAARGYRAAVNSIYDDGFRKLLVVWAGGDEGIRRALRQAKPRRLRQGPADPAQAAAYARLTELFTDGRHVRQFTDAATFLCSDSLSWRRSF